MARVGKERPGAGRLAVPACQNETGVVHSVGHSTRSLEELARLLLGHRIELLVDIRTVPRSRRVPQFNRERIEAGLAQAGCPVAYVHRAGLGGLRRGLGDRSPNGGWKNRSFRGFADHMLTSEFEEALAELITDAGRHRAAVMCAEALPWRCHRSLVADALTVRGVAVRHIHSPTRCVPHELTSFARIEGTRITYPEPP